MIRLVALLSALLLACGATSLGFDGGPPPADAGLDGGTGPDAGTDAGTPLPDAGGIDAGMADAGFPADAGPSTVNLSDLPANPTAFPLGVQSGDATAAGVLLWTKYTGSLPLRVRVVEQTEASGAGQAIYDFAVTPIDGFVHAPVGGLRPFTVYRYTFVEDGGGRSLVGRFRTAPAPNTPAKVRFGATSCTKQSYAPFPPLSRAGEQDLDFFMQLGDSSYNDDAHTQSEYRSLWASNLGSQGYLDVLASTSHITTWDDHEVVNDWDGETVDTARLDIAREAFFETLAIRRMAAPNQNRLWRSFRWGSALEIFVLDCRGERKPSTRRSVNAEYISPAQMAWLKNGLQTSTATFKLVANSVPIANFPTLIDITADDRWEGYQAQRDEVLDFIVAEQISGVLWVSGDFHLGAVAHMESSGPRFGLFDVLVGPGGNLGNPVAILLGEPQFEFTTTTRNYVIFEADNTKEPATLGLQFVDGEGQVLFEKMLFP